MEWFCYNLVILIELPEGRQSSVIFEKQGYLTEKLKTLIAPTTAKFNILCRNFAHISFLTMPTKVYM